MDILPVSLMHQYISSHSNLSSINSSYYCSLNLIGLNDYEVIAMIQLLCTMAASSPFDSIVVTEII